MNFHFANGTVAAIPARPPQLIRPAPPEQPLFGVVGYEVPENMLGAIRDCEGLREIKGLLSFNLRIELDWYSTRLSRYHRVPDESHRNQARLEEFEEELRRVLVKA